MIDAIAGAVVLAFRLVELDPDPLFIAVALKQADELHLHRRRDTERSSH